MIVSSSAQIGISFDKPTRVLFSKDSLTREESLAESEHDP